MMNKVDNNQGPDFIIIGAMKCATSTLHDQLAHHEYFYMSKLKEPNFFSDDNVFSKGSAWYASLFEQAESGQLCGESSTHYTKLPTYPDTVERIKSFYPRMKFIYIMRHPVDRLVSHYIHEWSQGVISCDIDEALQQFPDLVNYSRYSMQVCPYLEAFGSAAVLPLFAERMRVDPVRELQAVFDFLQVDATPEWNDNLRSNVSADRIRVCAWRDAIVENPLLQVVRRTFVPKKIRTWVRKLWAMNERPALMPESLRYVEGIFDRDLKELGGLLGVRLRCRDFEESVTSLPSIAWKL